MSREDLEERRRTEEFPFPADPWEDGIVKWRGVVLLFPGLQQLEGALRTGRRRGREQVGLFDFLHAAERR